MGVSIFIFVQVIHHEGSSSPVCVCPNSSSVPLAIRTDYSTRLRVLTNTSRYFFSAIFNLNIPIALKAIKLLATYLLDPSSKDAVFGQLEALLGDFSASPSLQLTAATLYMYDDNIKEALKAVKGASTMDQ
jgi:Coatomer epsilon subunit